MQPQSLHKSAYQVVEFGESNDAVFAVPVVLVEDFELAAFDRRFRPFSLVRTESSDLRFFSTLYPGKTL